MYISHINNMDINGRQEKGLETGANPHLAKVQRSKGDSFNLI